MTINNSDRRKSIIKSHTFTVFAALVICHGHSLAQAPRIDGLVISWPARDWWQVQRADDYSNVCNGGLSCLVSPGIYNVINHSTGQRYDNVVVPTTGFGDQAPSVSGNVISWPVGDWWQVQRATDSTEVCNGGSSCLVGPGHYIVINHDTGVRYENVVVSETLMTTADTAKFAGQTYKDARQDLNNIVTGNISPDSTVFSDVFAFALAPQVTDNLISGETTDCAVGGTISYTRTSDSGTVNNGGFLQTESTYQYDNCILSNGFVNGTIITRVNEAQQFTNSEQSNVIQFDLTFSQPMAEGTLQGILSEESSSVFNFIPECGRTGTAVSTNTLTLHDSTLVVIHEPVVRHYYGSLDHSETDSLITICVDEVESTSSRMIYDSRASYERTTAETLLTYEIAKMGDALSTSDIATDDDSPARLSAALVSSASGAHTMDIIAIDLSGIVLDVTLQSDGITENFRDEQDFRMLSTR